jgi:DNA polymerase-4
LGRGSLTLRFGLVGGVSVMLHRTILHFDLDAFFCSVEERLDPNLRGKPFIVGGSPEGRGVVASASYPARAFGIHSAMPAAMARRLCPDLLIIPSHHRLYWETSRQIMALVGQAAPVMEQISVDEAFLDVSDDPHGGRAVAAELQSQIRRQFDLPTSWGIASNKFVAKIAAEAGKPGGLVVVPPGSEASFLAPLPVSMLWGVGPKTEERLRRSGVTTIGELAALEAGSLGQLLGDHGLELAARARGEDARAVVSEHEPRSMSSERTFSEDVADQRRLYRAMLEQAEEVGRRLRQAGLAGGTLKIKVRWPDFTTVTRQTRLKQPTDQEDEILQAAVALFEQVWSPGKLVRLVGVGVSDLGPPIRQLGLFDRDWEHDGRLLLALDAIRSRYGLDAVRRGTLREPKDRSERKGAAGSHEQPQEDSE